MKTRIATLLLCTVLACTSSNVANAGNQNRETGTFRKIRVSSGIDVYFTQEKLQSIRIETENIDENDVITKVENETLVVKMKTNNSFKFIMKKRYVKVYISAPILEGLSLSGGSDFHADHLKSRKFDIASSGGADVHIGNLIVDGKTNISTSGGADVHIGNLTAGEKTSITASGGSDCNIKNLKTNDCSLAAGGGSDIKIAMEVSGDLQVNASGASDIKLSGKADSVWVSASGAADIDLRRLEGKVVSSSVSGAADIHK
jgi:hypothetical protein